MGAAAIAASSCGVFNQLIQAWGSSISVAWINSCGVLDRRTRMKSPLPGGAHLLFLAFGAGLIRVIRLRVAQRVREGGPFSSRWSLVVVSLLLLNEAP